MIQTIGITLKPEVVQQIRESLQLKNKLQDQLVISHGTLYSWLAKNSDKLTTATALKIIGEELGLTNDELLTA